MSELAYLKHRTASGAGVDSWWEFDGARRLLMASFKVGSVVVTLDDDLVEPVRLCSEAHPRHNSWVVSSTDGTTFRVHPARYLDDLSVSKAASFGPGIPIGSLLLVQAPENVAEELRSLDPAWRTR